MAEAVTRRAGGPEGRRRNRRETLKKALRKAETGRQVLAAATQYFRSTFVREDEETIRRVARELINLTDKEAGEPHDSAAD